MVPCAGFQQGVTQRGPEAPGPQRERRERPADVGITPESWLLDMLFRRNAPLRREARNGQPGAPAGGAPPPKRCKPVEVPKVAVGAKTVPGREVGRAIRQGHAIALPVRSAGLHGKGAATGQLSSGRSSECGYGRAIVVDAGSAADASGHRSAGAVVVSHFHGAAQRVGAEQQGPEPTDERQALGSSQRNQGRIGAVVPPQRDWDAVEEHGGLAGIGAPHRDLHLPPRILPHMNEGGLPEGLLQRRGGRGAKHAGANQHRAGATDRAGGARFGHGNRLELNRGRVWNRVATWGLGTELLADRSKDQERGEARSRSDGHEGSELAGDYECFMNTPTSARRPPGSRGIEAERARSNGWRSP